MSDQAEDRQLGSKRRPPPPDDVNRLDEADRLELELACERLRRSSAELTLARDRAARIETEHQEATAEMQRVREEISSAYGLVHGDAVHVDGTIVRANGSAA